MDNDDMYSSEGAVSLIEPRFLNRYIKRASSLPVDFRLIKKKKGPFQK
jgi:hypothetical protein